MEDVNTRAFKKKIEMKLKQKGGEVAKKKFLFSSLVVCYLLLSRTSTFESTLGGAKQMAAACWRDRL